MTLMVREATGDYRVATPAEIRKAALDHLSTAVQRGATMDSPAAVREYLALRMEREHEAFAVLFLDAQCKVLGLEELFRGTVSQTSVHPREIVKRALKLNASSVVLAHNHPSGELEPSRADQMLTQTLKAALQLVDVRVVDHIIVGGGRSVSFAERGLL